MNTKDSFSKIYLLVGEDQQEIKVFTTNIEQKLNKQFGDAVEFHTYFADEVSTDEIFVNIDNFPLFAEKKVYKIYNFEKLNYSYLEKYIKSPSEKVILLLISYKSAKEIFKAKSSNNIRQLILKNGKYYAFDKQFENKIRTTINENLRSHGIKATKDIVDYIISITNQQEGEIVELVNLITVAYPDKKDLAIEDIANVCNITKQPTIYDLLDSFFFREKEKTIFNFKQMIQAKTNIGTILFWFRNQIKTLWEIKSLMNKGLHQSEIKKYFRSIHPYVLSKMIKQASEFTFTDFEYILKEIMEIDLFIKSQDTAFHSARFELFLDKVLEPRAS